MHAYISAQQLAADIRNGKTTSVEATQFFIDRIEKLDLKDTTNCVVVKTYETALARAAEADKAQKMGISWGKLHGVPMVSKPSSD